MELVFVSLDRNGQAFERHYANMPWKALPFAGRGRKVSLCKRFHVDGQNIPKLFILDRNGRPIIQEDGMCTFRLASFASPQPPALLRCDFLWAAMGAFTWSYSERSPLLGP